MFKKMTTLGFSVFFALHVLLCLLSTVQSGVPFTRGPSPAPTRQEGLPLHVPVHVITLNGTQVCDVEGQTYIRGEDLPTQDPCEYCTCEPPGFACQTIACTHKPGCRSLQRSGLCCPEYICDCELNGNIYQNGDRVTDHPDPCQDCYCIAGEITCSIIACRAPGGDCVAVAVEGQCCPTYRCSEDTTENNMEIAFPPETSQDEADSNAADNQSQYEDKIVTTESSIYNEDGNILKVEDEHEQDLTTVPAFEVKQEVEKHPGYEDAEEVVTTETPVYNNQMGIKEETYNEDATIGHVIENVEEVVTVQSDIEDIERAVTTEDPLYGNQTDVKKETHDQEFPSLVELTTEEIRIQSDYEETDGAITTEIPVYEDQKYIKENPSDQEQPISPLVEITTEYVRIQSDLEEADEIRTTESPFYDSQVDIKKNEYNQELKTDPGIAVVEDGVDIQSDFGSIKEEVTTESYNYENQVDDIKTSYDQELTVHPVIGVIEAGAIIPSDIEEIVHPETFADDNQIYIKQHTYNQQLAADNGGEVVTEEVNIQSDFEDTEQVVTTENSVYNNQIDVKQDPHYIDQTVDPVVEMTTEEVLIQSDNERTEEVVTTEIPVYENDVKKDTYEKDVTVDPYVELTTEQLRIELDDEEVEGLITTEKPVYNNKMFTKTDPNEEKVIDDPREEVEINSYFEETENVTINENPGAYNHMDMKKGQEIEELTTDTDGEDEVTVTESPIDEVKLDEHIAVNDSPLITFPAGDSNTVDSQSNHEKYKHIRTPQSRVYNINAEMNSNIKKITLTEVVYPSNPSNDIVSETQHKRDDNFVSQDEEKEQSLFIQTVFPESVTEEIENGVTESYVSDDDSIIEPAETIEMADTMNQEVTVLYDGEVSTENPVTHLKKTEHESNLLPNDVSNDNQENNETYVESMELKSVTTEETETGTNSNGYSDEVKTKNVNYDEEIINDKNEEKESNVLNIESEIVSKIFRSHIKDINEFEMLKNIDNKPEIKEENTNVPTTDEESTSVIGDSIDVTELDTAGITTTQSSNDKRMNEDSDYWINMQQSQNKPDNSVKEIDHKVVSTTEKIEPEPEQVTSSVEDTTHMDSMVDLELTENAEEKREIEEVVTTAFEDETVTEAPNEDHTLRLNNKKLGNEENTDLLDSETSTQEIIIDDQILKTFETESFTTDQTETVTEVETPAETEDENVQTKLNTMLELETKEEIEAEVDTPTEVYLKSVTEANTEISTEGDIRLVTETETDTATEAGIRSVTEVADESTTDEEIRSITEAETETATEEDIRAVTEEENDTATGAEFRLLTESETATEAEIESITESETETVTEEGFRLVPEAEPAKSTGTKIMSGTESEITTAVETEFELAPESATETATEADIRSVTESLDESATNAEIMSNAEEQSEPVTEANIKAATELETETATESEITSDSESEFRTVTEVESETATETETQSVTESEMDALTEVDIDPVQEAETKAETEEETEVEKISSSEMTILTNNNNKFNNQSDLGEDKDLTTANNSAVKIDTAHSGDVDQVNENEQTNDTANITTNLLDNKPSSESEQDLEIKLKTENNEIKAIIYGRHHPNLKEKFEKKTNMFDKVMNNGFISKETEVVDDTGVKNERVQNQFEHLARKYGLRPLTKRSQRKRGSQKRIMNRNHNRRSFLKRQ